MNMVGVAIPRAHLRHPRLIILAFDTAEFFLYRSIDKDPLDLWLLGCCSDECDMSGTPRFVINALSICGHQVVGRKIVALLLAQNTIWHRHEPDVDVKPDLMAPVSERQWAASRLRHIAD